MLDLMKMKKCELIEGEMQAVVGNVTSAMQISKKRNLQKYSGPGLKKSQLNDFLQPHGLLFGCYSDHHVLHFLM